MATTAINIDAEGRIIDQSGVMNALEVTKVDTGHYEIVGSLGLATNGWRTSIYKDENGENTIKVNFEELEEKLVVKTFDPNKNVPKDIVHLLTLRLEVEEPTIEE